MRELVKKIRMNTKLQVAIIGSVVIINATIVLLVNFLKDDPGKRKVERCINGYWHVLDEGQMIRQKDTQGRDRRCVN